MQALPQTAIFLVPTPSSLALASTTACLVSPSTHQQSRAGDKSEGFLSKSFKHQVKPDILMAGTPSLILLWRLGAHLCLDDRASQSTAPAHTLRATGSLLQSWLKFCWRSIFFRVSHRPIQTQKAGERIFYTSKHILTFQMNKST